MAFKMKKFSGFGKGSGKGTPMNFNAGLRKASKEGKLDNNPKFKAAVDNAPVKMKKESPKKFLGKAIKSVGKFAKKNPGLVGGLVGGPAGMLAGKAIGGMLMKKAPNKMKKKK
tara:strand:- start:139 stop:477 length:339 start_codon:yes stop_codon:yes gene_type:complete